MYDIIIIGAGPGGYIAAERAGKAGLKVALIEKDALGGVCLNSGCIPTKTLLNSAKLYKHALEGAKYGVLCSDVKFDRQAALAHKNETVEKLKSGIAFLMKKYKVDVITGSAKFLNAKTVFIPESNTTLEAKNIIIATGSENAVPPIPGLKDNPAVIDSTKALNLSENPESLTVIGGGVIGLEFASMFESLGIKVTVIEMMAEILPFMDKEIATVTRRALRGISFELSAKVTKIEGNTVFYEKQGVEKSVTSSHILVATGRRPSTNGLDIEKTGVATNRGAIVINDSMQTNVDGIYAIGDCTGRALLAHAASRMAEIAVDTILGKKKTMLWDSIPWAVYTISDAGGAGLTEEQCVERGIAIKKATVPMRVSGRFIAENGFTAQGACKIIIDAESHVILGVHQVGAYASETIWGVVPFIDRKATIEELKETVFPHPTVAEVIREAALEMELEEQK